MFLSCLKIIGFVLLGIIALWLAFETVYWLGIVFVALSINKKKEYKKLSKFYTGWLYGFYQYMMIHARLRVHVTGLEKVPFGTQYLFVSNHRSKFDHMVHSVVLKKQYMAFISKPENFTMPIASQLIYRGMYLPIERNNTREALKTIIKASEVLEKGSYSIGVFPEGTRSHDGNILEYKAGCFKIATKANAPIVVAVTQGTENIKKNAPWKHTDIYMDIIKVYYPEDYKDKTTVDVCDEIYALTKEHLKINNKK